MLSAKYTFHTEKSENALAIFFHGTDFIRLSYCIFLLKSRPFKNYSCSTTHVDIYIVVGDTKCAISIILYYC